MAKKKASSARRKAARRLQLIHWNEAEAREKQEVLQAAGYLVTAEVPSFAQAQKQWQKDPPAAFVIDLTRLPMQGRDLGLALRVKKATRGVPLVFVGGEAEKVRKVKKSLPDATFADWRRIRSTLRKALANPPAAPKAPESILAGYSGTPLPKKLGIKENDKLMLLGAPKNFSRTLGELPDGVVLRTQARGAADLVFWFVQRSKDLEQRIERIGRLGARGLWICWPKQSSGVVTDVTQQMVRETGLAHSLVDYKIAAIDQTWSGLRFTPPKDGKKA